jgi:phosphoribosylpyrophosphate synthetase
MQGVTHPIALVVPISLSKTDEQFHHVLRSYKGSPFPPIRRQFAIQLAALTARFLGSHEQCIIAASGARCDTVTTVPSTAGRPGEHPLVDVVGMVRVLHSRYANLLAPGPVEIGHNHSDNRGFTASAEAEGRTILLLDDTFTTGARIQSAASALQLAGARVPAALVVGRVINPEWSTSSKELWEQARKTAFSFDRCCLRP